MVPAFPRKNEEQQSKLQACHSTPQQDFKKLQKYLANDTNAASACFAPGHCLDDVDCFVQLARCQDLSIVQMWGAQDWQKHVLAHVSVQRCPKYVGISRHLKTSQDISRHLKTSQDISRHLKTKNLVWSQLGWLVIALCYAYYKWI